MPAESTVRVVRLSELRHVRWLRRRCGRHPHATAPRVLRCPRPSHCPTMPIAEPVGQARSTRRRGHRLGSATRYPGRHRERAILRPATGGREVSVVRTVPMRRQQPTPPSPLRDTPRERRGSMRGRTDHSSADGRGSAAGRRVRYRAAGERSALGHHTAEPQPAGAQQSSWR